VCKQAKNSYTIGQKEGTRREVGCAAADEEFFVFPADLWCAILFILDDGSAYSSLSAQKFFGSAQVAFELGRPR
jgi:hypothetical protein